MKTENRDPNQLKPHKLVAAMHRPSKDSDEWAAFVENIRENGIRMPIRILPDGTVVDGETRRLAAKALQLPTVPCVVVDAKEVEDIILSELVLRRNLTKSQRAYEAYPVIRKAYGAYLDDVAANKQAGAKTSVHSVYAGPEEIAERFGISRTLFFSSVWLHETFGLRPDLKEQFERSIFDPDKPAGLGAVKAGVAAVLEQEKRGGHTGGKPKDLHEQLRLFNRVLHDHLVRWEYWDNLDDSARAEHWKLVRSEAAELPQDRCRELAEYHAKLAAEFRKAGKE